MLFSIFLLCYTKNKELIYLSKVIIECNSLIEKYKLDKEVILKQLEVINIKENKDFILTYSKDFKFTLVGEIKDNSIILTNIIKAIAYKKVDNSDILNIIK
ncbi:hypothetical protein H8707_00595 [Tissierellaceae bacterium BX21]|uniref:Uncharacterized protein n=1 Tax=Paratissierella segnis TaxID=2763679 RepID=A0A926ENH0_9FIRM|nr:hypothetical protein [Paratissierella segnis]